MLRLFTGHRQERFLSAKHEIAALALAVTAN
jgi:hypothetical protein